MEIEQGTFIPLVFTTTGGMADKCVRYHSRLAELIANKKGENYSSAISWIRADKSTFCDTTGGHFACACVNPLNDNSVDASNLMAGSRKLARKVAGLLKAISLVL